MALVKRTYVDGETIITAQNLNDIQDKIISHANTFVPKTRTINSKALDANITLTASDLGAVPTTRTVNSKALSSNITLTAADVSAVPTTRTVNSKALSSNITLTSGDIGYNSSTTYSSGTVGKAVTDLNGAINNVQGLITAYVQTSLTASRAYTSGEYFVYNNTLYRAKRDIASGATITIGTNAVATTVGKDLYGGTIAYTPSFVWSNSTTTPTVDNVGFSYAMLTPNLMFLFGRFRLVSKNVTATNNMLCMTLPTEYLTDSTRANTFGIVQGDVIENLAIRLDNTRIFFAYGGSGAYSLSHFTDGTYYGLFATIPVKLA